VKVNCIAFDRLALTIVLLYPIMVIGYVPFGGGIRYYSVLLPIAMVLMAVCICRSGSFSRIDFSRNFLFFCVRFLPFIMALLFVSIVHEHFSFFMGVSRGVLYASLLYALLKCIDPRGNKIIMAPVVACFVYLIVAVFEVLVQGRDRAWGLVYENTFGQFAVFCAGISILAAFDHSSTGRWRVWLLSAGAAGCCAAVLSGSRGALLPMVGLLTALFFTARQARSVVVIFLIFAALIAYFDVLGFYSRVLLAVYEVQSYFTQGHLNESSIGIRLELWRIALFSLLNSDGVGFGAMAFREFASSFSSISAGAAYMHKYYSSSESMEPWLFHGDFPQVMAFGGWVLLVGFVLTLLFVFKMARINRYALWTAWCGLVWGVSELFIFNRISFGLVLVNLALFCAFPLGAISGNNLSARSK